MGTDVNCPTCPTCQGGGKVRMEGGALDGRVVKCWTCAGAGRVPQAKLDKLAEQWARAKEIHRQVMG